MYQQDTVQLQWGAQDSASTIQAYLALHQSSSNASLAPGAVRRRATLAQQLPHLSFENSSGGRAVPDDMA
jgi:hypothetical protein